MRNDKENLIVKLTLEFALEVIEYTELLEKYNKFVVANPLNIKGKLTSIRNILSKIISTSKST